MFRGRHYFPILTYAKIMRQGTKEWRVGGGKRTEWYRICEREENRSYSLNPITKRAAADLNQPAFVTGAMINFAYYLPAAKRSFHANTPRSRVLCTNLSKGVNVTASARSFPRNNIAKWKKFAGCGFFHRGFYAKRELVRCLIIFV